MLFKSGDKEIKIFFLKDYHLELLQSKNIELSQLPYLPKVKEVSDDDCLDWLAFQRGVEKQYQNFSDTTYHTDLGLSEVPYNREGVVYKSKYNEVLNANHSVNLDGTFQYAQVGNKLFILNTNNTVRGTLFKPLPGELRFSIYQALLYSFSLFELYFRENKELDKTSPNRKFINLGFVISKIIK